MTFFFLLVGARDQREIVEGQPDYLAEPTLPLIAALGGMLVPALIFMAVNFPHPENWRGWAVPTATDIAFALGVLALVGLARADLAELSSPRLPSSTISARSSSSRPSTPPICPSLHSPSPRCSPPRSLGSTGAARRGFFPIRCSASCYRSRYCSSRIHATLASVILALMIPSTTRATAARRSAPPHSIGAALSPRRLPRAADLRLRQCQRVDRLQPATCRCCSPRLGIISTFPAKADQRPRRGIFSARKAKVDAPPEPVASRLGVAALCGIGFTSKFFSLACSPLLIRKRSRMLKLPCLVPDRCCRRFAGA